MPTPPEPLAAPPPPKPAARLVTREFLLLFAAALAFFTAGSTVLPVASRYAQGPLGADPAGVGLAIGIYALAALALRPAVGWAADHHGRRPLLLGGAALSAAALLGHVVATSLPAFVIARAVLGVGEAFFFVAVLAAITDIAPPDRQGEAINIGSLSVYLGLALGPTIGETVLGMAGFTAVWLVAGSLAIVATVVTWLVRETAPLALRPELRTGARSRLIHPAGLFPGFLILTGAWGMAGYFAFLPLFATEQGLATSGLALGLYALIVIGLRIVFAKLPDQMGPARLAGVALGLGAVGMGVFALGGGPLGIYLGSAIFAVGVAFMFPSLIAVAVAKVDETERGAVVGTTSVFLDLAFGLAPAALGLAAGPLGYGATFAISAGVAAIGFLALLARRRSLAVDAPAKPGTLPA